MTSAFTPEAARALGGPDWLVERRLAAAEQLDGITWPTDAEEVWRYSRIDEFDLDRFRPPSPDELGDPSAPETAPGGGPVAAEAGERAGLVVVRNGRVVHHELDETLARKGVQVCGLATCDEADVDALLGACSLASPDAFTALHDSFLTGGAFIRVPAGVVVEKPVIVLHWSEGEGLATFPHTLVAAEESSEVTVLDRFGSPDTGDAGHLVDAVVELMVADNARVRYLSVQEHGPHTWQVALQRAHVGRDASLHSSAVALGGDYARLRSESLLAGDGAESDLTAVYFGDHTQMLDFRTLQDHDAPNTRSDLLFKGAVEDQAHSVYSGLIRLRPDGAQGRREPDQPQPRAHGRRGGGVDPEPRDRSQRRAVLARQCGRSHRRGAALLPREPGGDAGRGGAPHRPGLLRRRARSPPATVSRAGAAALGRREGGAPPWVTCACAP